MALRLRVDVAGLSAGGRPTGRWILTGAGGAVAATLRLPVANLHAHTHAYTHTHTHIHTHTYTHIHTHIHTHTFTYTHIHTHTHTHIHTHTHTHTHTSSFYLRLFFSFWNEICETKVR